MQNLRKHSLGITVTCEIILKRLHETSRILTVASLKFELAHITLNNEIGYGIHSFKL
jgi:hypothetical protein